jgi:allantoinase
MLVIRGQRLVLPEGERPASLHIEGDVITSIGGATDSPAGAEIVDCGSFAVSPGLVDSHVHINEPGRAGWEGFDTATRAAAAGGVTTVVDMPLNSIPATTTAAALAAKRAAAEGRCHVDVAFWGGVVPDNSGEIGPLIDRGVRGFKCFLVPSGVDEFAAVDETALRRVTPILASRGVPLLVHAELPQYLRAHKGDAASYAAYEATRPAESEVRAIELIARLAHETGARAHIVHVSSAAGVAAIAAAQAAGVAISGETCPHYLSFADDDIPAGAVEFKCAPPIRTSHDRDALWRGLRHGVLSLVATDHSPAPPPLKCAGDFVRAWGGIASLELSLPAVWTGARDRDVRPADLARWMSEGPAALAGLSHRKGRLAPGQDADVVVWDDTAEFVVDPARLQQRHKTTPYAGRRLCGMVHMTFVRGRRVWDRGRLATAASGQLL